MRTPSRSGIRQNPQIPTRSGIRQNSQMLQFAPKGQRHISLGQSDSGVAAGSAALGTRTTNHPSPERAIQFCPKMELRIEVVGCKPNSPPPQPATRPSWGLGMDLGACHGSGGLSWIWGVVMDLGHCQGFFDVHRGRADHRAGEFGLRPKGACCDSDSWGVAARLRCRQGFAQTPRSPGPSWRAIPTAVRRTQTNPRTTRPTAQPSRRDRLPKPRLTNPRILSSDRSGTCVNQMDGWH
ncbi:MAG: hypothetical protein KatS3mg111_2096 [Pirellulaceae bacterium]|nr:MAG: hypothetical protein KatS3mg111_2096 [Pirellulaceae bacterium]